MAVIRYIILCVFILSITALNAQNEFYNSGASVYVQSAGLIYVQGEVINTDLSGNTGRIFNSGNVQLTGNWTNNSANSSVFQWNDPGTTTFLGANALQTIGGSKDTYFNKLTINKPGNNEVRLLRNSMVDSLGILTLNNDFLNTSTDTFLVTNPNPGAITRSGAMVPNVASSTTEGYVTSNSGSTGRLGRGTSPTFPAATYFFPVGSASRFRPVSVQPNSIVNNVYFVQLVDLPTPSIGAHDPSLISVFGGWYHFIDRALPSGSPETIRVYWDDFVDGACDPSHITLAEYNAVIWKDLSPATSTGNASPLLSYTTKTGYPGAYPTPFQTNLFALADNTMNPWGACSLLDANEIKLKLSALKQSFMADWTTDLELPSAIFSLERGTDGLRFEEIFSSDDLENIHFYEDKTVLPYQTYFYRVRMINQDGNSAFSNIERGILVDENKFYFEGLYPNPTDSRGKMRIYSPETTVFKARIINSIGQQIRELNLNLEPGMNEIELDFSQLATGSYLIDLVSGQVRFMKKVSIAR